MCVCVGGGGGAVCYLCYVMDRTSGVLYNRHVKTTHIACHARRCGYKIIDAIRCTIG